MGKKIILICAISLIFGCTADASSNILVDILNPSDYFVTGDLQIKACLPEEFDHSFMGAPSVNIYVTESAEWIELEAVESFKRYFDRSYVSVPGRISVTIPDSKWEQISDRCFLTKLDNVFVHTEDWLKYHICPFARIIIVANYNRGALNGANSFECAIP